MAENETESLEPMAKPKAAKSVTSMEGLYFGTAERSTTVSPYVPDSYMRPYNPDPLVQQDQSYGVYEEMLEDDQIDVALKIKKDLVVGSGWYIDTTDEEQGDLKKDLENLMSDECERPFSEILEDIIQAYEYGFSVSEKIFKLTNDGQLALKNIKPRHPASWLLHTDDYGNVTKYEQRSAKGSLDINPNSIIHYINNEKFQNPYGRSDLFAAFQAWKTKQHITRFYAIYLENAAGPKPVAKYDRRAPQSVVDDVFQVIKNFQAKTAMTIPKEFEIEFLEAKTNGEAFIKGINLFNMFLGRALFIPDLLGFQGSETGGGSFALGSEQIGVFYKHIQRRRQILERIVDQHILRPLIVYNYGTMEDYPKFKFNPLSDADAIKQSEMWIKGIQGAGWKPTLDEVNHFRSLIKFPLSDDLELKGEAMAEALGAEMPDGAENEKEEDKKPEQKAESEIEDKKETETPETQEQKQFRLSQATLPGPYKKKVDFKLADGLMKTTTMKIIEELDPIVTDAFEDLYSQLEKSKILKSQKIEDADNIRIKGKYLKQMQGVFKKHFRTIYLDGQGMAKAEVKRSNNAVQNNNIAADEFLDFLNRETFQYLGDYEYTINKKTRTLLTNAIKDGDTISSVVGILDDEGKKLSDISLERYSRTKTTEVFNRGRKEYFDSTGVVDAYQFSAILDDVTSERCGELNGLTFPAGTSPIPPLHFNCRSVLIPITKYEDYQIDEVTNSGKSLDKFLDEIKDSGFAIYSAMNESELIEKPVIPQITDPGVSFTTEYDGNIETIKYSINDKLFQITKVIYEDDKRQKVLSTSHQKING